MINYNRTFVERINLITVQISVVARRTSLFASVLVMVSFKAAAAQTSFNLE